MNCSDAEKLIEAYCDGELDLLRHVELEEHLAQCGQCGKQEQRLRELRAAISTAAPYYQAPDALRKKISKTLAAAGREPELVLRQSSGASYARREGAKAAASERRRLLRWTAIAAGLLLMVGLSLLGSTLLSNSRGPSDQFAAAITAAHIRSLQVEHLMDVASTDQHTVKPWFRGKLDFSPPTPDLSAEGYPLVGGRLDYLVDGPAAAIVYMRRAHVINVFIRRANSHESLADSLSSNGYHLRFWRSGDLDYVAISDVSPEQLGQFVEAFRAAVTEARPK